MTTIRYFLPEDGDDENYPNVFLAPKPRHQGAPPTLQQVRDAFPLPGRYHFRFKAPLVPGADRDKGGMAVWMDAQSDNAPVSTWKNAIVCKVTRISMEDDEDSDDEFQRPSHATPAPRAAPAAAATQRPKPTPAPPPAAEPLLDVFESSGSHARHHSNASSSSTGNLLDVPAAPAAVPPAPSSGGSLLDMDAPSAGYSHASSNSNNAHADFLGMTAPAATPQQQPPAAAARPAPNAYHPQQPNNSGYAAQSNNGGYRAPPPSAAKPQQQSVPRAPSSGNNAFDSFSNNQGPFGGLQWGN